MASNEIILSSVGIYVVLFILAWITFRYKKFSGDAAGKGMEKGLLFFLGLIILFLLAIAVTIFSFFSFSEAESIWVRIAVFVPPVLPVGVFLFSILEIGR